jgi:hypothetical protein
MTDSPAAVEPKQLRDLYRDGHEPFCAENWHRAILVSSS